MTVTLTGREIFPSDGNPIIGADVYAYRADTGALVDQTTTDANGDWSMTVASLAAGYNTRVVYGQGIRWGYINQRLQAQSIIIDGSVTVRDWANANDFTKIDGGDIYVGSLIQIASSGSIRSGQTAYNTGTGWWLGDVSGTPKFSIGNPAGNRLTWDGSTLAIAGTITATTGTIGGWTLGTYSLNAGSGATSVGLNTDPAEPLAFFAGDANPVIAPFRLTKTGALTATSATITGAITATSGTIGSFTIGTYLYTGSKTAWNDANAGVHVGSDGIGIGNNVFTVNGSTGAMVATNATLTGSLSAASGDVVIDANGITIDPDNNNWLRWIQAGDTHTTAILAASRNSTGSDSFAAWACYPHENATPTTYSIIYLDADSNIRLNVKTGGAEKNILLVDSNGYVSTLSRFYPGSGVIQSTRYISDDGTQTYISAGLKVAGLAGTGTRTVVVDANGVMSAP